MLGQPRRSHADPWALCTSFHKVNEDLNPEAEEELQKANVLLQKPVENLPAFSPPGEMFGYFIAPETTTLLKCGWKLPCVSKLFFDGAACADVGWGMRLCWAGLSQGWLCKSSSSVSGTSGVNLTSVLVVPERNVSLRNTLRHVRTEVWSRERLSWDLTGIPVGSGWSLNWSFWHGTPLSGRRAEKEG